MNTKTFEVEIDNKKISLAIRSPSLQDQREATKIYNTAFSDALKAKAVVRAKLDDLLVEQGLWDAKKQKQFTDIQSAILDGEKKLAKGGIGLSEAKKIALEMKKQREELRDLISVKTSLDTHTAEGQADNARFNYLVSVCTVYNDSKKPYFNNYDDYLNRASEPAAILAAQNMANMLYGLDNDYENKLPENKFLADYKFVDNKLRLVDKQGRLIDSEGRLIDESGRFINENGEFVDKDGNVVNKDGEYIVEFKPFLDDDGKPIIQEKVQDTESTNGETEKSKDTEAQESKNE